MLPEQSDKTRRKNAEAGSRAAGLDSNLYSTLADAGNDYENKTARNRID